MKKDIFVNIKIYIFIFLIIFISDIYTKYWILKNFQLNKQIYIMPILNILHIHNYGLSLNLFNYKNRILYYILIINILCLTNILYIIYKNHNNKNYSYIFIISGAFGNFINRLYYGFIIDFIDIHINNFHFFAFNIADISIFIGVIKIIINDIKNYKKK